MKYYISIFFLLWLRIVSNAQSITWQKQFHFDKYTGGGPALEAEDGGYLVIANINDGGHSRGDIWVVKLGKYGNFEWRRVIDTANGPVFGFIKKSKGIYSIIKHGGSTDPVSHDAYDEYTQLDFNENGEVIWSKKLSPLTEGYVINKVLPLTGGNYIGVGYVFSGKFSRTTPFRMLVQKFDRNHIIIWSDTLNFAKSSGTEGPVLETHDHHLWIGGAAGNGIISGQFVFMVQLDTNGKQLRYIPYQYRPDSSEQIDIITEYPNGNLMVESSSDGFYSVYFTLKDSNGKTLKMLQKDGVFSGGVGSMVPDGDSIYLLACIGLVESPVNLLKLDSGMNKIWEKDYSDTISFANTAQMIRTSDGGFLISGWRRWVRGTTVDDEFDDMVVIKLDSNGNLGHKNYSVVENIEKPVSYNDNGILYPNPATTNIYINPKNINTGGQPLNLDIFDSRGQLVSTSTGIGARITQKDISFLNKGLYFYRLYGSGQVFCNGKFVKE